MIIVGYFFLFLYKNICCGYSLETPHRGVSNEYPQHMFLWRTGENYPRIITKYSSLTIPLGKKDHSVVCCLAIVVVTFQCATVHQSGPCTYGEKKKMK